MYAIFDTETNGLPNGNDFSKVYMTQIAIIITDGKRNYVEKEYIVKGDFTISQEITDLTGITKQITEEQGISFEEIWNIINANIGGDTPEKFQAFLDKHDYKFNFAYDFNSEIYKLLKLQQLGLPVLLIIDKEQNIRIQHVGYNTSETHFRENLIKTIKSFM